MQELFEYPAIIKHATPYLTFDFFELKNSESFWLVYVLLKCPVKAPTRITESKRVSL